MNGQVSFVDDVSRAEDILRIVAQTSQIEDHLEKKRNSEIKSKTLRAFVTSIFLYACETWT